MTFVQRQSITSPVAGLLVFQTDVTVGVYYYDGTNWVNLTTGTPVAYVNVVSTLAGGSIGYADGTGTAARFFVPWGIAYDGSANLYVADSENNRIRKIVVATGEVTTLAGNGNAGAVNGTGTAAEFYLPRGIAYHNGNLYVAEYGAHRIRRIAAATGVVTSYAGSTNASLGSTDGLGSLARFDSPTALACDASGTLYVADLGNNRIRKITGATTGVVTTLAGSSQGMTDGTGTAAQFSGPIGVACDASGNVYVADAGNHRIRKIVAATGVVTTLAGSSQGMTDGTGTAAQFSGPIGVGCDPSGNVYVTDAGNNRVRKVVAATGAVTTLAGGTAGSADGLGTAAQFDSPRSVVCDSNGNAYVTDGNSRIRVVK
ncbi:hypothetical protein D3Y59_11950 [Hymenobacter oligotrophus]|uniref:Teneurin NHL domain-containing protein n=2 Tax=Hymenobacter oligotrophus TaxID=2319843 RepID=A0A3B7R6G2_9BACT|nr:hypothetical protein D3Y59_11950 [Hymenobacter oligotrophus]